MVYKTIGVSGATHERIKALADQASRATGMSPTIANALRYALKAAEEKVSKAGEVKS